MVVVVVCVALATAVVVVDGTVVEMVVAVVEVETCWQQLNAVGLESCV